MILSMKITIFCYLPAKNHYIFRFTISFNTRIYLPYQFCSLIVQKIIYIARSLSQFIALGDPEGIAAEL